MAYKFQKFTLSEAGASLLQATIPHSVYNDHQRLGKACLTAASLEAAIESVGTPAFQADLDDASRFIKNAMAGHIPVAV